MPTAPRLAFHPLDAEHLADWERLFGPKGACAGCWCMWWRVSAGDFEAKKGASLRRAARKLVRSGAPTGLLAYAAGKPVAWCAVAPRADYPRLGRSRILKPVDDREVWSVTCFFVAKAWRGRGLTVKLLREAARHVRAAGGRWLEGYPHDVPPGELPGAFVHTGLLASFERAGFREVARRSPKRPVMRKKLG